MTSFVEKGTYTDALSNEARPKWYVAISNTLKMATKRSVPHLISKRNAIVSLALPFTKRLNSGQ